MTRFFKIASRLAVAVLAVSTFAMPAAAKSDDQELIELINFLSTPLTTPMQFPQLDAQDLFSQDNPDDVVAIEQVFSAYVFYNDSHNGPGLASLYLPNGVDDHGYNNGAGEILPSFGIGGNGCVLRGTQQIATYISHVYGDTAILPFPGHTHHVVTSMLVRVVGDDAMMQAVWNSGEYLTTYKRQPPVGWMIRTNHVIVDAPRTSTICDLNGPLPRTGP